MFTLRKITRGNVQINIDLGDVYIVFTKERATEEVPYYNDDDVYLYIRHHETSIEPLFKCQKNYIVSDSGKTFDNLTYR